MWLITRTLLVIVLWLPLALHAQSSSLEELYKTHQYFALRDEVNRRPDDRSPDFLFYRGVVANRFNRLEESIRYLTTYRETKNAEKVCDAYEILADDYVKTYRYARAAEMYKTQLTVCKDKLSEEERAD